MVETRAELPFTGDQVGLFRAQPGRPKRSIGWSRRVNLLGFKGHKASGERQIPGSSSNPMLAVPATSVLLRDFSNGGALPGDI